MILNIFRRRNLLRNMRMQISNLQFDVNINREEIDKLKNEISNFKQKEEKVKEFSVQEDENINTFKDCLYCQKVFVTKLNAKRKYCPEKFGILNYCKNRYCYEKINKNK